ncbi:4210_t:CDS:2 [Acaulospora morrowiae]|uniref:4210_t:CDS:1 n=1 Tax=Acaulospora morrowiae TaxID=94023 RepID=A0A9N8WU88_9GLOM|nr:4210_t:CDS:2 [Acaulospora morrowiae]
MACIGDLLPRKESEVGFAPAERPKLADADIISVSNKNRKRMKIERNLSHKVSVKLFVVHQKDARTFNGSIEIITPIPEKMYKRMQLLHAQMMNGLQHPAGLNPKSFRLLQLKQRLATNSAKGILDEDLLIQFPNLALNRQREMTKQIGTTIDRIIDNSRIL